MAKTVAFFLLFSSICGISIAAEAAEVRLHKVYPNGGYIEQISAFDGKTVTYTYSPRNSETVLQADLENLVLDTTVEYSKNQDVFAFELPCKTSSPGCFRRPRDAQGAQDPSRWQGVRILCGSHEECQRFLDTLRAASNPTRARSAGKAAPHGEPVIDGKNIPKEIKFGESRDTAPPREESLDDFQKRTLAKLEENRANNFGNRDKPTADQPRAADPDPFEPVPNVTVNPAVERFKQLVEDVEKGYESTREARRGVGRWIEMLAPKAFDKLAFDDGALNWGRFAVKETIKEWARDQFTNFVARQYYGQNLRDLPQAFQKDFAVLTRTFERVFQPFRLSPGFRQDDAHGEMFDNVNEEVFELRDRP